MYICTSTSDSLFFQEFRKNIWQGIVVKISQKKKSNECIYLFLLLILFWIKERKDEVNMPQMHYR